MTSGHVAEFLPSTSGLKFSNHFPTGIPVVNIPLPIGHSIPLGDASNGVCGGMVYAAMDLFLATPTLQVPATTTAPVGGSPMMTYLARRLVDSFALERGVASNVARYLRLMSVPDRDAFIVDGVGTVMAKQEWPKVKRDIDAGRPAPLGLVAGEHVSPMDFSAKVSLLGHCHQVLAYAYEVDDDDVLTLDVYDPNDPGADDSTIVLDLANSSDDIALGTKRITSRIAGHTSFRAFFRHANYRWVDPPEGISPGPAVATSH